MASVQFFSMLIVGMVIPGWAMTWMLFPERIMPLFSAQRIGLAILCGVTIPPTLLYIGNIFLDTPISQLALLVVDALLIVGSILITRFRYARPLLPRS